ncbi:DsbA family protein [Massilia endophytica]|uniref:DsbA family protein n=1 Tax=Massilia endophytica TaxID=2899220 RepID=UPI001E50079E|nr:DsbA family protein [Massilia endophytica]UGQ45906.1 DsbA family protein [Massilia endophytica]
MKQGLLAGMLLGLCAAAAAAPAKPSKSEPDVAKTEAIVHNYLLKNPSVLREAFAVLQRQEAAAAEAKAKVAVGALHKELFAQASSPVAGNPDGDVTIVEFFDYHCGYCKRAAPVLKEVLASDPRVRVVYKQLPILGPDSILAARMALAAERQNKYQPLHDALFSAESLDEKALFGLAAAQGLDLDRLRTDMFSTSVTEELEKNLAMAAPLGINGTPGFVIGDSVAPGALDLNGMQQMIAAARRNAAK